MKTKTFLLSCLLLGIGLTNLSAQKPTDLNSNGTGTIVSNVEFPFDQVIYRDGVEIDWVYGTVAIHFLQFFKDWNLLSIHTQCFGEATSNHFPFEVFKVQDIEKATVDPTIRTFHFNMVGNLGSRYIGYFVWDYTKNDWWDPENVKKMVFPGDDK